MASSHDPQGAT